MQKHMFKEKLCILIAINYPKQAYERDPEVLHLYVKDIRILTLKEYDALKTAIQKEAHKPILGVWQQLKTIISWQY